MRQVRSDDDRSAFVEFTELDFLLAPRRFEENKLRAAAGSVPAHFLQTEHVAIK